jgi:hypothetical protein
MVTAAGELKNCSGDYKQITPPQKKINKRTPIIMSAKPRSKSSVTGNGDIHQIAGKMLVRLYKQRNS